MKTKPTTPWTNESVEEFCQRASDEYLKKESIRRDETPTNLSAFISILVLAASVIVLFSAPFPLGLVAVPVIVVAWVVLWCR